MLGNCNVCESRPGSQVLSSPYGATSHVYCDICAVLMLEPTGMVSFVVEMCGGWDQTGDHVRGYPAHALQCGLATLSGTQLIVRKVA